MPYCFFNSRVITDARLDKTVRQMADVGCVHASIVVQAAIFSIDGVHGRCTSAYTGKPESGVHLKTVQCAAS